MITNEWGYKLIELLYIYGEWRVKLKF
jgi:hypothetical protein